MREKDVAAYLARQGQKLKEGYNRIAADLWLSDTTQCKGHPARTIVNFSNRLQDPLLLKSLVQQELIKRGILWSGFHTISFSHTDADIDYTLAAYREVLTILQEAIAKDAVADYLRGEPVQPVFRKTGEFNTKPVVKV